MGVSPMGGTSVRLSLDFPPRPYGDYRGFPVPQGTIDSAAKAAERLLKAAKEDA